MATDISSEFPVSELIGKRFDNLTKNDIEALSQKHTIEFGSLINIPGFIDTYIIFTGRMISLNDYSAITKLKDIYFNWYIYKMCIRDNIDPYDHAQGDRPLYIQLNKFEPTQTGHFNMIKNITFDNDVEIPNPDYETPAIIVEISYDPGKESYIEYIQYYLLEDLTVNMWRVSQWLPEKYQHFMYYDRDSAIQFIDPISGRRPVRPLRDETGSINKIKIYGFNSELLKEIHRFSWMRRRSAIIRPDELFDY